MDVILEKLTMVLSVVATKADHVYLSLNPCFVGDFVTESFTVLVGFVAIGIPLSLQVISRATEKYKSDHLIKYLSSWKWVTPQRIYWASIIFIVFGLFFKSLLPTNDECSPLPDVRAYAWSLIIIFLMLIVTIGFWFGHLFTQATKSPKEIYDALKK